jgi:hypothetical protein
MAYNFIRKEVSLQADRRRAGAKLIKSSAIYGMINQLKWCYSAINAREM